MTTARVKVDIISSSEAINYKEEMHQLYTTYYEVDEASFFKRFTSNDWYAIYKAGDKIIGFTGVRIKTVDLRKRKVNTLYLGQTVMHQNFRGRSLLPRTSIRLIIKAFLQNPTLSLYIWCDSLTYKPYLLFANSLKEYYPSRHQAIPQDVKNLLDHLGEHYYGDNYDPVHGTVFKVHNIINDITAIITPKRRQNPDIDFFASKNPNHHLSHGLVTITPMHWRNFLFLIKKCLRKMVQPKIASVTLKHKTQRQPSSIAL